MNLFCIRYHLPVILLFCLLFSWPGGPLTAVAEAENPSEAGEMDPEYLEFLEEFEEEEEAEETLQVADPLYYWNKSMYYFNDRLYFWVLKPVARGYQFVTPQPVRTGFKNFFTNLTTPVRFVNCLLQGKSEAAGVELGRFMVNTTFGGLGFFNLARLEPSLQEIPDDEDLGQTLAVYGIGNGFYIVWPVLGPSTLRDTLGTLGDGFLDPVAYVDPTAAAAGIRAFEQVNGLTFRLGDYETLKDSAIEPYEAIRNAYIQNRQKKIKE